MIHDIEPDDRPTLKRISLPATPRNPHPAIDHPKCDMQDDTGAAPAPKGDEAKRWAEAYEADDEGDYRVLNALARFMHARSDGLGYYDAMDDALAALIAELEVERARVQRLQRLARFAPAYGFNARSFSEREAMQDCQDHSDMDDLAPVRPEVEV